jgi:hypothetical protein
MAFTRLHLHGKNGLPNQVRGSWTSYKVCRLAGLVVVALQREPRNLKKQIWHYFLSCSEMFWAESTGRWWDDTSKVAWLTSFNLCIKANQSYPEMILPLFSTKDMRWLIYDSFRASYPLQLCYILTWHDITEILMASPWAECKYGHQIHVPIIHRILDPVWKWEMYLWTFCWGEMFPSASSKQRITSCKRAHCSAGLKFTDICS